MYSRLLFTQSGLQRAEDTEKLQVDVSVMELMLAVDQQQHLPN